MYKQYFEFCKKIENVLKVKVPDQNSVQIQTTLEEIYAKHGCHTFEDYFKKIQNDATIKKEFIETIEYYVFCEKIDKSLRIKLLDYKENQMKRRLKSLYEKKGCKTFQEYYEVILKDENIKAEFLDRITINVSEFFRNYPRWKVLEDDILPALMEGKRKLKIWSAACSTGEEPYTLVMLLAKYFSFENIQIIATDIDDNIIKKAKRGIYNEYAVKSCPKEYLDKYFKKIGNDYAIDEKIKKCVTFRKHDLLKDNYEKEFDLIVCRNVMIYFTEEAKEKMYHKFGQSLRKDGIFFVGSTEQIFQPQEYGLKTEKTFFYRRTLS